MLIAISFVDFKLFHYQQTSLIYDHDHHPSEKLQQVVLTNCVKLVWKVFTVQIARKSQRRRKLSQVKINSQRKADHHCHPDQQRYHHHQSHHHCHHRHCHHCHRLHHYPITLLTHTFIISRNCATRMAVKREIFLWNMVTLHWRVAHIVAKSKSNWTAQSKIVLTIWIYFVIIVKVCTTQRP